VSADCCNRNAYLKQLLDYAFELLIEDQIELDAVSKDDAVLPASTSVSE
jgi:hypothetical protein